MAATAPPPDARPRDRCSRLGRCRLHDHLRNGAPSLASALPAPLGLGQQEREGREQEWREHRTARTLGFGVSVACGWAGVDSADRTGADSRMAAGKSKQRGKPTAVGPHERNRMTTPH